MVTQPQSPLVPGCCAQQKSTRTRATALGFGAEFGPRLNFSGTASLCRATLQQPSSTSPHKDNTVNRRDFSTALFGTSIGVAGLSLNTAASAQGGEPAEGKQFTRIDPPVPAFAPGKIEVVEYFSYACPHCSAFEPTVEAWAKKLPADVAFYRVPVAFLMNYENFMRTYYALETMGQVGAMQRKVFTAVHVDRVPLDKPADIAALMAKNGIDATKFMEAFGSFTTQTRLRQANQLVDGYKIDGVPAIGIQGRYYTSGTLAGNHEKALAVTDLLVQRLRKSA